MNVEEQIGLIKDAADDPKRLALAILEISIQGQPPEIRRVLQAAAVPRWFDGRILGIMVDEDLQKDAAQWLGRLTNQAYVESFPAREAWNLHESTRSALRSQLQTEDPERMTLLSTRAMSAFDRDVSSDQIENTYHRVIADPSRCYETVRALEHGFRASPNDGLALAQALAEYAGDGVWPHLTRAWALLVRAEYLAAYRPIRDSVADAGAALELLSDRAHPAGTAWALVTLGGFLLQRGHAGDADRALTHYRRGLEIRKHLSADVPESILAARDLAASQIHLADTLALRDQPGDSDQALGYYRQALGVHERLLMEHGGDAQAARDLTLTLDRLGDFHGMHDRREDADLALASYRRAFELRERLFADIPNSVEAARDLSVSLNKLGDLLVKRGGPGDTGEAIGNYERAREIADRLLATNPQSSLLARDLAASLQRLGDFLDTRARPGDAAAAFRCYRQGRDIVGRLAEADPQSAEVARDLSVIRNKLGHYYAGRGEPGDAEEALANFALGLEIRERLAKANPQAVDAALDLSVSLNNIGDILLRLARPGDLDLAHEHYQRSLAVTEHLRELNPGSMQAARAVSVCLERIGDLHRRADWHGDLGQSLHYYERCLKIRERLGAENLPSVHASRDLCLAYYRMAWTAERLERGDAVVWWQKAYEVLTAASSEGRHLSGEDLDLLQRLRRKVVS